MENFIKTYPCGLRIIVRPMPSFKSVATSVHVGVGSRNETATQHGLSHFVEHMLFKGTERRTAEQIAAELSNLGVQYNAYTSNTATCYHTKGLANNLDTCCDILADMFFNLKFADDEFKREAEVIVQEISMRDDHPRHALHNLCAEVFFRGTDYEHSIAGTAKDVRGFKPADIHDYIKTHYTAPNTIISFAGDVTMARAEAMVEKYFLPNFKGTAKPNVPTKTDAVLKPSASIGRRKKHIAQHNVAVLFPAVNFFDADRYKLVFVDGILSQDMSSRLFASVRERLGLVYSISGGLDLTDIGGYYYITFACTPENTATVLKTIKTEIARMKADGVTAEEVAKVKNVKRADRLFESEDVEQINQRNVTQLCELGFIETAEEYLKEIDKITEADVAKAANKYLDMDGATICIVGDKIKI